MKTLTRKMVYNSFLDQVLLIPRFGIIISITWLILLPYLMLFNATPPLWLWVMFIGTLIISIALHIFIKRSAFKTASNNDIVIVVDTVYSKNVSVQFNAPIEYYVCFTKTGPTRVDNMRQYSKYQKGDHCFLTKFEGRNIWHPFNCNTYQLSDELQQYLKEN